MRTIAARSVSAPIMVVRPPHLGHGSTSITHTRHSSRARLMRLLGVDTASPQAVLRVPSIASDGALLDAGHHVAHPLR